jgi:hypothetical protein
MRDRKETRAAMNDHDRALCAASAGLLRASGAISAWGLALSFIAGGVLALTGRSLPSASWVAFALVGLAGLVERYLALRLQQESALFDGLARGTIDAAATLDAALVQLGLRRNDEPPRPLAERVLRARLLMQRHGLAVVVQTFAFALALALEEWR